MNSITAGPSDVGSAVFAAQITSDISASRNTSYYSNIEPDFKWARASVKHLIYLVSIHFDEFYDKTLKKKVLWKKIAEEMRASGYHCSSDDCDKKWRNIKKTYISVLQKQVRGDFTSKFPYFDEMHEFLGKEIDPLGMREQGLSKAIYEKKVLPSDEFPRFSYCEVTEDDNFHWHDSAVHFLLDSIIDHKNLFESNVDITRVWESIRNKMFNEGYEVVSEQCQRKWINLSEGFRHHHAEAELTGIHPKWNFYTRVKKVLNTLNVPITVSQDHIVTFSNMKGSLTTPTILREPNIRIREPLHKRRKRKREASEKTSQCSDEDNEEDVPSEFRVTLRRLQEKLNINDRLTRMENKIEMHHKVRAEAKQTFNILESLLEMFKGINKSLQLRKEEMLQEEQEAEEEERLKNERLLLNQVGGNANIVVEGPYKPTSFIVNDFNNLLVKDPKEEFDGHENDNIIIVEGLS